METRSAAYGTYSSVVPVPVVSGLASQPPIFPSTTVQANQADFLGARAHRRAATGE